MFKTCAVLLICLAMFVAGKPPKDDGPNTGGDGGNADSTGTGGPKPNANNFFGNCRKNDRECPHPDIQFCAPPGNNQNANPNSQWKCYYCYCNDLEQCYLDTDSNVHCNCTGSGYVGEFCNETFCNPNKCQNGATCNDATDECECAPGYSGTYCESSVCDEKPCLNGGSCQIDPFKCFCTDGFYGDHCEFHPCDPNPCALWEECVADGHHFKCISACKPNNPCLNGGTCNATGEETFNCECPPPFTGDICDENPCDPNPCALWEECVADGHHYKCISACKPNNPCLNGGTCTATGEETFICDCPPPFTGDICDPIPCDDNGSSGGTGCSGGKGKVSVSVNVDVC